MIIITGSRLVLRNISSDYYTLWRGFLRKFNRLNHDRHEITDLIEAVRLLRAAAIKKNAAVLPQKVSQALVSLSEELRVLEEKLNALQEDMDTRKFGVLYAELILLVKKVRALSQVAGERIAKLPKGSGALAQAA